MHPFTLKRLSYIAAVLAALTLSTAASASTYNFRVASPGLKPANVHLGPFNFTSCGTTGNTGPASCTAAYSGTSLNGMVTVSAGIQSWTVPATGVYTVVLAGASGGRGTSYSSTPGRGAVITTSLPLSQGTVVKILVGQAGGSASWADGGGGGGTYLASGSTPLAIAGGGAGSSLGSNGNDASTNTSAATALTNRFDGISGSGGAGFSTDGNQTTNSMGGFGIAKSFLNGGVAPNLVVNNGSSYYETGGFGGGGGGGVYLGGAGGGYTPSAYGAGGNSYSSATITSGSATNTGAGYVSITLN